MRRTVTWRLDYVPDELVVDWNVKCPIWDSDSKHNDGNSPEAPGSSEPIKNRFWENVNCYQTVGFWIYPRQHARNQTQESNLKTGLSGRIRAKMPGLATSN